MLDGFTAETRWYNYNEYDVTVMHPLQVGPSNYIAIKYNEVDGGNCLDLCFYDPNLPAAWWVNKICGVIARQPLPPSTFGLEDHDEVNFHWSSLRGLFVRGFESYFNNRADRALSRIQEITFCVR